MAARVGVTVFSAQSSYISKAFTRNILAHHLPILHRCKCSVFLELSRCFSYSPSRFAERRYSKKHEWVSVNGKIGTVGISQYAQESLGDVVYVQLPEVDSEYTQDDECGAVESVKAASEIYTPISGKVTEVNSSLEDNPALVNQSCYDKGWLFRLEMSKPEEYESLLNEEQYDKYLKTLD